ncbi:MAG: T9SS type A sorting domain-containing protein, partial [Saprospiraceae bacterium]
LTPNYTITVTDLTPSQLKIEVKSSSNNPNTLYLIDNTADQLIHLKIDITNLAGNTGVGFDEINMQGASEFFDIASNVVEPFHLVKADDELELEFNNFAATILLDSITPTPYRKNYDFYRGGYDTLYLYGKHFGDITIPATNRWVEFNNAHEATGFMKPLEEDYIIWTDSLIIVKVPAIGKSVPSTPTTPDENYAGTGTVKISSLGLYSLPQNIQIPFSVMNWRVNSSLPSFPHILVNRNGIGGYTLTYDTSFYSFPNSNSSGSFNPIQAFEKALIQWRCATGLNFIINDSIPNLQWENPSNTNANEMIVGFDPSVSSLGQTSILLREVCDTNYLNQSSARYYVEKFSILFSPTTSWWFDEDTTTFLGTTQSDFISAALHELGHAHLLNHTKNYFFGLYETMYWLQSPGSLVRQIDINSDIGGNFISDFSTNASPSSCFSPMIKTQSVFCDIIDRTDEYKHKKLEINIFPNPANDNLNLEFSELPNSNIQLILYDLVGRRIMSKEFPPNGNLQVDIADLSKGTYFIKIKIGNSSTTQKIIKF